MEHLLQATNSLTLAVTFLLCLSFPNCKTKEMSSWSLAKRLCKAPLSSWRDCGSALIRTASAHQEPRAFLAWGLRVQGLCPAPKSAPLPWVLCLSSATPSSCPGSCGVRPYLGGAGGSPGPSLTSSSWCYGVPHSEQPLHPWGGSGHHPGTQYSPRAARQC